MKSCYIAFVIAFLGVAPTHAQTTPTLTITAPMNGTLVQAGQTIQITVAASNVSAISREAINGTLGTSALQPPATTQTFSLTVPGDTPSGNYSISAVGLLASGVTIESTPVVVSVSVGSGTVSGFRAGLDPMILDYPGEQLPLVVIGITNQGDKKMNPQSLSFTSGNPAIATVSPSGLVTAQSPGGTQIAIGYEKVSTVVHVAVQGGLKGDLDGNGQVDIDDVHILEQWLNTSANGPNDARDLNHDGKIDALDARILTTLCTYPHCATHP